MPCYSRVANGNIAPSRFVKLDTTAEGFVLQCGAGDQIYGISQPGTRNAPYGALDDGFAAIKGNTLSIYGPPEKDVPLELGASVTRGQYLKADVNGKGIATAAATDIAGAIALDSGSAGDLIPVQTIVSQPHT